MTSTAGEHVEAAVVEMVSVLSPHSAADWMVSAGPLDWTCWRTAAHVAHDLFAYAGQLAASRPSGYLPARLELRNGAAPADLLDVVRACGRLLVGAIQLAGPDARAWHFGPTDATGFEAMAVGEVLLHTHDITEGLGAAWRPPTPLCAAVLARLFPELAAQDPVATLLWATGRAPLDGREPVTSWVWRAALT